MAAKPPRFSKRRFRPVPPAREVAQEPVTRFKPISRLRRKNPHPSNRSSPVSCRPEGL